MANNGLLKCLVLGYFGKYLNVLGARYEDIIPSIWYLKCQL